MRRFFTLVVALSLAACATKPPRTDAELEQQQQQWRQHQQVLKQINHWKITGRFGAQNGANAWNGQIIWVQDARTFSIQLAGPVGLSGALISGNATQATLSLGKDQQFVADDAESLLYFHTGLHLPVTGMQYWITGQMAPSLENQSYELDAQGHLSVFQQQRWQIQVKDYVVVNGLYLPRKLYLSHPDYQVRLVIDRWEVNG